MTVIVIRRAGGTSGWSWVDEANGQLVINGSAYATLAAMTTPQITAEASCDSDAGS